MEMKWKCKWDGIEMKTESKFNPKSNENWKWECKWIVIGNENESEM